MRIWMKLKSYFSYSSDIYDIEELILKVNKTGKRYNLY